MRGFRFLALTALLVWAVTAAPVHAITFGTRDTALRYPYVGALVAEFIEPGQKNVLCTGTLIAASVFLTAGHCTDFLTSIGIAPHDVWVTFDLAFSSSSTFRRGTYHTHLEYGFSGQGGFSDPHDIAVVVLDSPVGITPARLPTRNLLNTLNLRAQRFTAVGYGTVREIKQTGPNALFWDPVRRYAAQGFLALRPQWLSLSMNPSTGSGGTCYGDSGGPHFLGDTNRIVSITVTGDIPCRATDVTYRLDTDSARAFLRQWVTVP